MQDATTCRNVTNTEWISSKNLEKSDRFALALTSILVESLNCPITYKIPVCEQYRS